jgi:hypothetical protein
MVLLSRSIRAVAVVTACGLLLSACADGDDSSSQPADPVTKTVTESPTASTEPTESPNKSDGDDDEAAEDDDGGGSGTAAGLPPKPRRDECVDIAAPRNGRYRIYDAGTAVVRRDGGRLRVGSVNAARGWRARVDRGDGDEVDITFRPRQRGAELELEVEIDDGRIESKICADDQEDDRDDDRDDDRGDD